MSSDTIIETKCDLIKWSAWFGKSAVGTETVGWEKHEDEYGCRTRYEYIYIPSDDVTRGDDFKGTGGTLTLEGMLLDAQPEDVAMLTVQYGEAFMALGWMRKSEALVEMRKFLSSVQ